MNRLARREVAIVSPHAGTTRDIIEVHLDLDGYPVTLIDTAGIRETDDPVEQEGVRRARARAADADLVFWLIDAQDGANRVWHGGHGADRGWCTTRSTSATARRAGAAPDFRDFCRARRRHVRSDRSSGRFRADYFGTTKTR